MEKTMHNTLPGAHRIAPECSQGFDPDKLVWDETFRIYTRTGRLGQQDRDVCGEVFFCNAYDLGRIPLHIEVERVIDVGAHIGTFSSLCHRRWPRAEVTCIEAAPENLACLQKNCYWADVLHGACTYEEGEVWLLNSILEGGTATGGSILMASNTPPELSYGHLYRQDRRPLRKYTLDELVGDGTLDILKLDCEGSEFSILENAKCLDRVRIICGEYHDEDRWQSLVRTRFPERYWHYVNPHRCGGLGTFWLRNRRNSFTKA